MYTVVRHTGFNTGHSEFEHAVESRALSGNDKQHAATKTKIEAAGGVVFETYGEAEDFCEAANYPPGNNGLVPTANGTFTSLPGVLDGEELYIPVRQFLMG